MGLPMAHRTRQLASFRVLLWPRPGGQLDVVAGPVAGELHRPDACCQSRDRQQSTLIAPSSGNRSSARPISCRSEGLP